MLIKISIIYSLFAVFERDKIYKQSEEIPSENPEKTLLKMIYNTPYTLEHYKSLKSKTALLDQSIESGDGNAILCVSFVIYQIQNIFQITLKHFFYFLGNSFSYEDFEKISSLINFKRSSGS